MAIKDALFTLVCVYFASVTMFVSGTIVGKFGSGPLVTFVAIGGPILLFHAGRVFERYKLNKTL